MKTLLAIGLGKVIFSLTRFLNIGGGSAAPGLYALKAYSELVEKLVSRIPKNIVITGTNGKTTTSRLLAHFAKDARLKVIRNHTGSNLERGIASTLIQQFPKKFDLGIWELDEAAFNTIVPKIKPDMVVFLNVSRDQLDRYGEVDKVVNDWCNTLSKLDPKTAVLINQDDENLAKLESYFKGKVEKFGKKNVKNVKIQGLKGSKFQISNLPITLPLAGIYHIYDFVAAFKVGQLLGFDPKKIISSLKTFSPAFGRVEKLDFGYIFLIKNPAGATHVFETIAPQLKKNDRLLLALNDKLADGTDVSWIWDANFEELRTMNYELGTICSGTRAYDLANRLKYAGFDPKYIVIEPDLKQAFKKARRALKGRLFILPTYTAMLKLQSVLTESGIKKHYWREE